MKAAGFLNLPWRITRGKAELMRVVRFKYIPIFYLLLFFAMGDAVLDNKSIKFDGISKSCGRFSSNFYQILSQKYQGNIVSSPFSAYKILSVLYYGAADKTMEELKSALHFSNPDDTKSEFNRLLDRMRDVRNCEFELVSSMCADEAFELDSNFLSESERFFKVSVNSMNFKDSIDSSGRINRWVKEKTREKISHVIDPSDIDEFTKLILINVLYFKSSWLNPFDSEVTENRIFYNINNAEMMTPMMFKKLHAPYGTVENLRCSFVKLKYLDEQFEMIIVLPNEKQGLIELEKNFDWNLIANAESLTEEVELHLPKFKVDSNVDLKAPLQYLGINLVFEEKANFSLLSKKPLYIDKVIQKVVVEVNEKGSEATAATVAQIRTRRMITETIDFIADHPFLFIIHHIPSNIPLFIGSIRQLGETIVKDEL